MKPIITFGDKTFEAESVNIQTAKPCCDMPESVSFTVTYDAPPCEALMDALEAQRVIAETPLVVQPDRRHL